MPFDVEAARKAVREIPVRHAGPGGSIAVIKDGQVIDSYAFGHANLDTKEPLETSTTLPICSITKHMLCFTLLDLARADPGFHDKLATEVTALLPHSLASEERLNVDLMAHNQSGIRDYWALTVLWGAKPGDVFSIERDAPKARERLGNVHFEPGSQYSYSNVNFHVLARAAEKVTGQTFDKLIEKHVFKPAGMKTARLCPDTAAHPGPCVGYEGRPDTGYFQEHGALCWSGDAGAIASLEDMIAWEKLLDASYADKDSVYNEMIKPQTYSDGTQAYYRHGLGYAEHLGVKIYGHGGALPGYRIYRLHAPKERVSVVVMRNSEANPTEQAYYILEKALGLEKSVIDVVQVHAKWEGAYLDHDHKLLLKVEQAGPGKIALHYAGHPESLTLIAEDRAEGELINATIKGDELSVHNVQDNRHITAKRLRADKMNKGLAGKYHSAEIDSTLHISGEGGLLFGSFDGYLGKGPAHLVRHVGENVWALQCPRSLDSPAPGTWTLVFEGGAESLTVGCWLARKIVYRR